jgi:hypothetical protein
MPRTEQVSSWQARRRIGRPTVRRRFPRSREARISVPEGRVALLGSEVVSAKQAARNVLCSSVAVSVRPGQSVARRTRLLLQ